MPVYIIDADGPIVRGSLRLLPTTGPTLSEETFSDTIPDGASLSAPAIWNAPVFAWATIRLARRSKSPPIF
jgi:acyl homoserine lactone synthase